MSKHSFLYYDELKTPLETITLIASEMGICRVDYGEMEVNLTNYHIWSKKYFLAPEFINEPSRFHQEKEQLLAYFRGDRQLFDLELDLLGTPFQKKVWQVLYEKIPYGETRSYKQIAEHIQAPKAVRAVGGAVNKNPISIIVPCHRVIGSNGSLVGYNGGMDKKKHLLRLEKAPISW